MAGPYAAFLLIFAVYPIVFALVLVFLQWDLVTTPTFAGADNVRLLIHDGRFWRVNPVKDLIRKKPKSLFESGLSGWPRPGWE